MSRLTHILIAIIALIALTQNCGALSVLRARDHISHEHGVLAAEADAGGVGVDASKMDHSQRHSLLIAIKHGITTRMMETLKEIREWYAREDALIAGKIQHMPETTTAELKAKAMRAYELRKENRLESRRRMRNNGVLMNKIVDQNEARDLKVYGNKDGPDFDTLVDKYLTKLQGVGPVNIVDVYRAILVSAGAPNKLYTLAANVLSGVIQFFRFCSWVVTEGLKELPCTN